jgi:hypothetical protein
MGRDLTNGETEDWLIKYERGRGRWSVTRFDRPGSTEAGMFDTKGEAKRYVKSNGFADDVVTVFTKSGKDWSTRYVRQMSNRGRGLFDNLG